MLRTVSAQSKRMCGPDPRRRAQIPPESLGQIALAIGLIEVFWSSYFTTDYKDVAAFMILAITLIFMPSGILGRPEVEKV